MSGAEGAGPPGLPGRGGDDGAGTGPPGPLVGAGPPPGGAPPRPPGAPYGPPPDLVGGTQAGSRARAALWLGLGGYLLQLVCVLIVLPVYRDVLPDIADDFERGRMRTYPELEEPQVLLANLAANAAFVAILVAAVVFLLWFHKASTNAKAVGLPLTRSPGWAVGGFFVPIVNLWFPYQAMRDLFPPGHRGRALAGRWWATYLGGGFLLYAAVYVGFVSTAVGWVLAGFAAASYAWAAITARELISMSSQAHDELAATHVWPTSSIGFAGSALPAGSTTPGYPGAPARPDAGAEVVPDPGPPKDPWGRT